MKKKNLILSAFLVGSLGLLFFVSSFGINNFFLRDSVTQSHSTFKDDLPDWAADSIDRLSSAGIIHGYANGKFGAADKLTRGQVITVLFQTLTYKNIVQAPDKAACPSFNDVKETDYYYTSICFLTSVTGQYADGDNVRPNGEITRGEVAKLLDSVLGDSILEAKDETLPTKSPFKDVSSNNEYLDSIKLVNMSGLMTGRSQGIFDPNGLLNRAEMASIMDRTLNLLEILKIKELAQALNKEAYMSECADLIAAQSTACSKYTNWIVDVQVLKQNTKTNKSEIEIDQFIPGPGNECDSSEAGGKFPADIKTGFLSNLESGGGEDIQMLCKVTCTGWNQCSDNQERENDTPPPASSSAHSFSISLNLTASEHTECGSDCVGYISDSTVDTTITFNNLTIDANSAGSQQVTTSAPFSYTCSSTAGGGKSGSVNDSYDTYATTLSTVSGTSDPSQGIKIVGGAGAAYYKYYENTCDGTAQDPYNLINKALEKAFGQGGELYSRIYDGVSGETVSFGGRDHDAAISNEPSYFEYSGSITVTRSN